MEQSIRLRSAAAKSTLMTLLALLFVLSSFAEGQTFTVLHNFTNGADGALPYVGLSMDAAGNLYGAAAQGGLTHGCGGNGCGTIFKLTRHGTGWTFAPLYTFSGGADGAIPVSRVIFGPNGTLYGTTYIGGSSNHGVVFNLHVPAHISGGVFSPWTENVLYTFGNETDGNNPQGDLLFDAAGNIYGTTSTGGYECEDAGYCGTVYQLTPHGNSWTESILYEFTSDNLAFPLAGVIADHAGNLYGTVSSPASVFELIRSGSGWSESTLFQSQGESFNPTGSGVILGSSGHLYGTTPTSGSNGVGTVFELIPSGGAWTPNTIYSFTGDGTPLGTLVQDSSGNLYGTTSLGGTHNSGSVFKLTPSGGSWTETDLYDFTGGNDGYAPMGNVILDSQGNIYGTTLGGGSHNSGTVFLITP